MATTQQVAKKQKKAPVRRKSDVEETLGVKYLSRVDPDEDFSDVDGDLRNEFALENEDPTRHYHWAHKDPNDIGQYKGGILGYRVEYYEPNGVMARMHSEHVKGEAITKRDHVLVSCDKEMWQKRNRFEHMQTRKTNARMFKRRQRDLDMRPFVDDEGRLDRDAFRESIAEDAADAAKGA